MVERRREGTQGWGIFTPQKGKRKLGTYACHSGVEFCREYQLSLPREKKPNFDAFLDEQNLH